MGEGDLRALDWKCQSRAGSSARAGPDARGDFFFFASADGSIHPTCDLPHRYLCLASHRWCGKDSATCGSISRISAPLHSRIDLSEAKKESNRLVNDQFKGRVRETPTPGCAGLRPACLPSCGKYPLGKHPSRPAATPPPGNEPANVRQKSGPEARAPREPRLTCRNRPYTNLDDDVPQSIEGGTPFISHSDFHLPWGRERTGTGEPQDLRGVA